MQDETAAQRYLDSFFKNLTNQTDNWQVYGIFMPSLDAYREAVRWYYEAQAYEATAVMCRDSIDGCVLLAISRVPVHRGRYNLVRNPDKWGIMKPKIKKLLSLTSRDIDKIETLRESGNFSAHIVARLERESYRMVRSAREQLKSSGLRTVTQTRTEWWISKTGAKKVLNRTGYWLTRMMRLYFKVYSNELSV